MVLPVVSDHDGGDVVALRGIAAERLDVGEQRVEHLLRALAGVCARQRNQPVVSVFLAGRIERLGDAVTEGDIKVHTKAVLDQIQQQLESAGSSMEKVLKCNVYLNDLKDYAGMNEMFQGRFGAEPPVRTTIAAAGGIPGNSLVEIDVIAYI